LVFYSSAITMMHSPINIRKMYAFEIELALRAFIPSQTRICIYAV